MRISSQYSDIPNTTPHNDAVQDRLRCFFISDRLMAPIISLLLLSCILAQPCYGSNYGANSAIIDLDVGLGLPGLINFNVAAVRLFPVTFGFGLGTIPIESIAESKLNINPKTYEKQVNGYTIIPSFSLSWTSFETFIRYHFSENFYAELLYASWYIRGNFTAKATGGQLGSSQVSLGAVDLSVNQPMVGALTGYKWFLNDNKLYMNFNCGVVVFQNPSYTLGTYTAADAFSAAIPADAGTQIDTAKQEIRTAVNQAMSKYKEVVKYGPIITLGLGIVL